MHGADAHVIVDAATPLGCAFTATDPEAGRTRCFDAQGRLIGIDTLLTGTPSATTPTAASPPSPTSTAS
jgi:hypothetical protein